MRADFTLFANGIIELAQGLAQISIGGPGYLDRYILHESDVGSLYVNHFMRGDADQELHSHPWLASSLILRGGYREERRVPILRRDSGAVIDYRVCSRDYLPGDVNVLAPDTFHRVDLLGSDCWTLFQTGPRVREWAFWCRETRAETPWREFTSARAAVEAAFANGQADALEAMRDRPSPVVDADQLYR